MNYLKFKENKNRGTFDFPIEFYFITPDDIRYNMPYHWHTEIEFIKVLYGKFPIVVNDGIIYLEKNDIIFISPEMLHGGTPKDCTYECILLNADMFMKNNNICNKYLKYILDKDIVVNFDICKNPEIKNYLNKIFYCMKYKKIGYEFLVQGYLYIVFGLIIENDLYTKNDKILKKNKERITQLKRVLEYIEKDYAKQISLEDLANKMNLNPKYFTKIFNQMTGKTPIQYLNTYRIEMACELLLTTHLSITDIALNCGFNDLSYFIKTFRKEKNLSPKKFRAEKSII